MSNEQDKMDITRQVTNTVYSHLSLDKGMVNKLKDTKDSMHIAFIVQKSFQAMLSKTPFHSLARDLASVALLYCDWDIVVARLQGKED